MPKEEEKKKEEKPEEKPEEEQKDFEEMTDEEKEEERKRREEELEKRSEEPEEPEEPEKKPEEPEEDPDEKVSQIVEEKLKPFKEQEADRKKREEAQARDAFFKQNPQYLTDSKKWQSLLDEMDNLNPNLDYSVSLEKAHRILDGFSRNEEEIDDFKESQANAASGSGENQQTMPEDNSGLTVEEKRLMKNTGVSEEAIKLRRKKQRDGSHQVFYPVI